MTDAEMLAELLRLMKEHGLVARATEFQVGSISVKLLPPAEARVPADKLRMEQARQDEEIMYASAGG